MKCKYEFELFYTYKKIIIRKNIYLKILPAFGPYFLVEDCDSRLRVVSLDTGLHSPGYPFFLQIKKFLIVNQP